MTTAPVVYVDVDDTLVRSFGSKQIPIDHMVAVVKAMKAEGVQLFCWSSGGADYARGVATWLGIAECFVAFLPKPNVLLDDVEVGQWKLRQLHPNECRGRAVAELL